jgi:hypothetical protein
LSTFIKYGDPRERRKSSQALRIAGDLVEKLYMANKTRNEDQIDRAMAHNLVGNR